MILTDNEKMEQKVINIYSSTFLKDNESRIIEKFNYKLFKRNGKIYYGFLNNGTVDDILKDTKFDIEFCKNIFTLSEENLRILSLMIKIDGLINLTEISSQIFYKIPINNGIDYHYTELKNVLNIKNTNFEEWSHLTDNDICDFFKKNKI